MTIERASGNDVERGTPVDRVDGVVHVRRGRQRADAVPRVPLQRPLLHVTATAFSTAVPNSRMHFPDFEDGVGADTDEVRAVVIEGNRPDRVEVGVGQGRGDHPVLLAVVRVESDRVIV